MTQRSAAARRVRRLADHDHEDRVGVHSLDWFERIIGGPIEAEFEYMLGGEWGPTHSEAGAMHQLNFYGRPVRKRWVTAWERVPKPSDSGTP